MRRIAILVAAAGLLGGCVPKQSIRPAYYGPTDPLATVIEKLNAQRSRVMSLRFSGTYSADLVDPQTKKRDSNSGDATLMFMPPSGLRLAGKFLGNRVFDMGANAERYWMIIPPQDVMYWGTIASAGRSSSKLPVRPDLLAEVLNVTPIPTDLLKEPAPVLRFNNDQDCYMLTWNVLLADRFAVQKEVWFDRQSLQPRLVLLFDANGRVVLRAYPSDPKKVDGYDPPLEMPSTFDLAFPDSGSTFVLRFRELERERDGFPNASTFAFPGERAKVSRIESLDQ